jgi:microtubule-associated protein-like 6
VIGTQDGHLYGFQGRTLMQSVKGHKGKVNCLFSAQEGLISGGKDGVIKIWSPALEPKAEFMISNLSANFPDASIRSLCWNVQDGLILVGTRANEVYEMNATDGTNTHGSDAGPLVQGHCKHELWGLAVHPHKNEYCTVGDDQTVRVWNVDSRALVRMTRLDTMARACTYSPDGNQVCIYVCVYCRQCGTVLFFGSVCRRRHTLYLAICAVTYCIGYVFMCWFLG